MNRTRIKTFPPLPGALAPSTFGSGGFYVYEGLRRRGTGRSFPNKIITNWNSLPHRELFLSQS